MSNTASINHGEVSSADNSAATVQPNIREEEDDENLSEAMSNMQMIVAPKPPSFDVTYYWDRVYTSKHTLPDEYVFNRHDITRFRMVHVLEIYREYRKRTATPYFDEDLQQQVMSELCKWLHSAQLLEKGQLPGFSFFDDKIYMTCPSTKALTGSIDLLHYKDFLSVYRIKVISKGFPFLPRFWRFKGLSTDTDEERFMTSLKSYITTHEAKLGKTRAAWVKFYEISGIEGKRAFAGSLLLLTEQVALLDTIPAFRGVKPEVETRPSLCG